jgi:hypothetical protein
MTHRHPDPFVEEHSCYHKTPIDEIEPLFSTADQVRETELRSSTLIINILAWIGEGFSRRDKAAEVRYWQVCFALGGPTCQGQSMTSVANRLGCERATISKGAVLFCEANDLPANPYLKCESSRLTYREARIAVVIASANGSNGAERH